MRARQAGWAIAIALAGQSYVWAAQTPFIIENRYRNPVLYTHQNPDQKISAYGEVDIADIGDRIAQIKILFPEIYSRFFTEAGKLKAGFEWLDYQKAIQAHYAVLKEDAKKLYGEKSDSYRQIVKEIEQEEFDLQVARNFDNKFGNFTSSRSNFQLNVIPADLLQDLHKSGVNTASQLRVYKPKLYRQYIGSKQLQSDFYLGPIVTPETQHACRPEAVINPVCQIKTGSNAQDAAKSVAACVRAQGDAKKAAKIAAETAQQIGAGKKESALILSAIGDSLKLNAAERNLLASEAARSMCSPACVVTNPAIPSYIYPLQSGTDAFDAAQAAADYAVRHKDQAARIAAETAVQVAATAQDQAVIMAVMMEELKYDAKQKIQFMRSVENLNCIAMPADLNSLSPGAGNDSNPAVTPPGGNGFDNPGITPGPQVSPN